MGSKREPKSDTETEENFNSKTTTKNGNSCFCVRKAQIIPGLTLLNWPNSYCSIILCTGRKLRVIYISYQKRNCQGIIILSWLRWADALRESFQDGVSCTLGYKSSIICLDKVIGQENETAKKQTKYVPFPWWPWLKACPDQLQKSCAM